MTGGLSAEGRERVLATWAAALGTDAAALATPGVRVVERPEGDAAVVLAVGDACVVVCPPGVVAAVRDLPVGDLVDAERLAGLLPVPARPLGTATLAFADGASPLPQHAARRATGDDLDEVRARVDAAEWDESGLADLTERWAVSDPAGRVVALAGFSRWRERIAQLGVVSVSVPEHRGHGYARSAATAALARALEDGLVAQWRSSLTNEPSARLGTALGFVALGTQGAVLLEADAR